MIEGAHNEQSDGEQVTPMDFLLLTYPTPDTWDNQQWDKLIKNWNNLLDR